MNRVAPAYLPTMRRQGLVVDDLPDEVLVYDLDRHKAHCLNRTAALVWRHCDGKTRAPEIARRLQVELDAPCNEDLVWLALRQLATLHLLEQSVSLPPRFAGMSRRQMIRNLGLAAAVAVPLVTSIVAPTAAQAATCKHNNAACTIPTDCCSGVCTSAKCVGG
jgi:hypothetical protein